MAHIPSRSLNHCASWYTSVLYKSAMGARPPQVSPYRVQYPAATSDLFPVAKSIQWNLLENDIITTPRMRDWMFSSVTSRSLPAKAGASAFSKASIIGEIGTVNVSIPRLAASASESVMLPSLDHGDGIITPCTWSLPSASTASAATSAESMPPERPRTTSVKPFFRT